MVLLTGVLLIPSMLLGIGGLIGAEILLFFLMWQVLDGAMALGVIGLAEMGAFIFVLAGGLIYLWKRGALEWD